MSKESVVTPALKWFSSEIDFILSWQYGKAMELLEAQEDSISGDLSRVRETLALLTQYYEAGANDPERNSILLGIGRALMQQVRRATLVRERQASPYSFWSITYARTIEHPNNATTALKQTLEKMQGIKEFKSKEQFEILEKLFSWVWVSTDITEEEYNALYSLLLVEERSRMVAQPIIGALLVGSYLYFDPRKVELLFALWQEYPNDVVKGAALSALLMIGAFHKRELEALHPQLVQRVQNALRQDEQQLILALKTILVSFRTREAQRYFEEHIQPGLAELIEKVQGLIEASSLQEAFQNLPVEEVIDEEMMSFIKITPSQSPRLGNDEQDAAFHYFSNLKTFPFFGTMLHWFMPFDREFYLLSQEQADVFAQVAPLISQDYHLISSDLYSLALVPTWKALGESMFSQLPTDITKIEVIQPSIEDGMRELVFGAYRFFELSYQAQELVNPFKRKEAFVEGAFVAPAGTLTETGLTFIAQLMVRLREFADAGMVYERIMREYLTDSVEVWRGMVVASLARGNNEEALYRMQQVIDREGITEQMALKVSDRLVQLKRKQEAVDWLTKAEAELGERATYRIPQEQARILTILGKKEEATKALFKASYLFEGDNQELQLSLIPLLLEQGKIEEATKQLQGKELTGDLLMWNALIKLATEERTEGLKALKRWHETADNLTLLKEAIPLLDRYGIKPCEQALIIDIIVSKGKE